MAAALLLRAGLTGGRTVDTLRRDVAGERLRLVGPQRIGRGQMFRHRSVKQHGRALPLVISQVGAMLAVANERGQI